MFSIVCFLSIGHVMISYQWGSKPIMIEIKDRLKAAGFSVWMDIENMSQLKCLSILTVDISQFEKYSLCIKCFCRTTSPDFYTSD